jgi:uncharacterized protein YutE (UPF0331/DUF86 family)
LTAFRNLIIHSHNRVDDERLLETVERDVPELRDAIRRLLEPGRAPGLDRDRRSSRGD